MMINIVYRLLVLYSCAALIVEGLIKTVPSQHGRVCAFGDFNGDRNTDVIAQQGANLTILLQDDKLLNVLEEGTFTNSTTFTVGEAIVECTLGDFNGDSKLDVLVSKKIGDEYEHTVWFSSEGGDRFDPVPLDKLQAQAMSVDVDGDGMHDVVGFYPNGSLFCITFPAKQTRILKSCTDEFPENFSINYYPGMPHLYVDVTDDLLAEFVFMEKKNDRLSMLVVGRWKNGWKPTGGQFAVLEGDDFKYVGAPMAADFDADARIDILVPICRDAACTHVTGLAMGQISKGWSRMNIDLQPSSATIRADPGSLVLFRVGDFTLDGYPDLIATSFSEKHARPIVLENSPCSTSSSCDKNVTRKFELRKFEYIQPKEVAIGIVQMSSFFDLKEDGNLDILVEYQLLVNNEPKETKFSFIVNEEKGDVTFLKVQVFTNVCDKRCNTGTEEIGSGISWGGACATFEMSDGWGGSLKGSQCQLPAITHRSLMSPYLLYGLGRSPNFVDVLTIGAPIYSDNKAMREHSQKQIVPNSRIVVIPPGTDHPNWTTRLYVTPSQLILQSLGVMALVCCMLLMVVAFLHYREKKEDRMERQQQSHRFHFDAM